MLTAKISAIVAILAAALYLLHRLCDWAEAKGWVYYRKTKASGNALGTSALQIQGLFGSGNTEHILEAKELKANAPLGVGPDNRLNGHLRPQPGERFEGQPLGDGGRVAPPHERS